jgi:pimeloyl-ACP methyl ester carboxylesterase
VPFIDSQGARIYWDERSVGEPVLLIMGLGYPSDMWWRTRPLLDGHYRTIVLDNRGSGRSDVPPGPYPIPQMAADAAAVLDAAGVEGAHVFGISMGGMIAQELALEFPERVRSLMLGCTAAGGPTAIRAEPEVTELLMNRGAMTPEQSALAAIPYVYDRDTARDRIEEDLAIRRGWFPKPEGYVAQLQGILGWESYSRLPRLNVRTLVIHGETDRLVPLGNAELIAGRIPGAKLVTLPHASHIFPTDQTAAANGAILEFLAATY